MIVFGACPLRDTFLINLLVSDLGLSPHTHLSHRCRMFCPRAGLVALALHRIEALSSPACTSELFMQRRGRAADFPGHVKMLRN